MSEESRQDCRRRRQQAQNSNHEQHEANELFGVYRQNGPHVKAAGLPHSKTLREYWSARMSARFWSAAVLCRFCLDRSLALHIPETSESGSSSYRS